MAIFENFKIVFMKNIIYDNDSSCSKRTKHDEEDEGRKDEKKQKIKVSNGNNHNHKQHLKKLS